MDFAYRIHTDVGNRCTGAKVNGKMVPLSYVLANGDIIEIITSSHSNGPSRDWLNIVKSTQAKNKIRQWFKKERREENIARGKEMIEREAKRQGYDVYQLLKYDFTTSLLKKMGFASSEDLFSAIGYGGTTSKYVLQRVIDEYKKNIKSDKPDININRLDIKERPQKKVDRGIKVEGVDNILVKFSRCCNPVPGDKIVGYITRGRGVSIHRQDCPNVELYDNDRLMEVKWEGLQATSYPVDIEVSAYDRAGMLSEIINVLGEMKTTIDAVNARASKSGIAVIDMMLEINDKQHLENVMQRMRRIRGVFEVRRVMNQ
jgi:GTP pyrophosphokinase